MANISQCIRPERSVKGCVVPDILEVCPALTRCWGRRGAVMANPRREAHQDSCAGLRKAVDERVGVEFVRGLSMSVDGSAKPRGRGWE